MTSFRVSDLGVGQDVDIKTEIDGSKWLKRLLIGCAAFVVFVVWMVFMVWLGVGP